MTAEAHIHTSTLICSPWHFTSYFIGSECCTAFRPLPRDNSVGIAPRPRDVCQSNHISTPALARDFLLISQESRPSMGPSQPPSARRSFLRVKLSRREADNSPASTAQIKDTCSYAFTLFIGWILIMHRGDCIFTFPRNQREESDGIVKILSSAYSHSESHIVLHYLKRTKL
jgi:hypothetical protein